MRASDRLVRSLIGLGLVLATGARPAAQDESSAVADAAKRQDWTTVQARLDEGANVRASQGDGATALHWAVYWDAVPETRRLLAAGASLDATNDLGVTPLWLASNNGSASMVDVLLTAGADPDSALPSGETALMTASRTGSVAAVRALLRQGADVDATEGSHGQTALMWAVAQRHAPIVAVLIEFGADVHARSHIYPQVINSAGNADPSGVYEIVQGGYTALLFAARHGALASVRLLVAGGGDVNDVAPMGTSALVVAAHSGQGRLAAFLLEHGADPHAAGAGYTALHAAVLRGDLALVTSLMASGANPDTPLLRGTPARRVSADWRLGHNLIGATPFWLAARFREPDIMRVLAEHGADPLVSKDGVTAVMVTLQGGTTRGRFGVSPTDRDAEGRLTLEAVTVALEVGADGDATNEDGDTALHLAASRGLDDVITRLAEYGASLNVRNGEGETPLSVARARSPGDGAPSSTVAVLRGLGATDPRR
ncbi:MAG: ankyrin repeat domain-containing protein [bacterium]